MDSQASKVAVLEHAIREQHRPTIIPRPQHGVSRSQISENALKVLYRLKDAGYQAYLVGGSVRDLLLGKRPKDFDVATDARPEQVRELFRNCRLIGRRFRLAHVYFGGEVIEVATFRAASGALSDDEDLAFHENGRILRDNVYGSIEEDALRRDFTINALYYDIRDFSLVDYTNGMQDLATGTLRMVGDPRSRYQEDPVRLLRAVRFAAKLGFALHADSEKPVYEMGSLLEDVPAARLFDEVLKLFHGGFAQQSFELLNRYRLLPHLFPDVAPMLSGPGTPLSFVDRALANTDARVNGGLSVTPAFLYAVLLWEAVRRRFEQQKQEGVSEIQIMQTASHQVIVRQVMRTALPKRFSIPMQEIWLLQPRFGMRNGKRALRFLTHPRFRAAYDFYCLRAAAGESPDLDCDWWTRLAKAAPEEQDRMTRSEPGASPGRTRSRRRRKRAV